MRILQLSDPHLVAADAALVRNAPTFCYSNGLCKRGTANVLISGELCQDGSWGGYVRL